MKIIIKYLKDYFVEFIFFSIIIYYFMNCIKFIKFDFNTYFLMIPIILIWYLMYYYLKKIKKNVNIRLLIILFSLIVYFIWNIKCNTLPVSDYKTLIDGAKALLDGSFTKLSFSKDNYFYYYNFQVGYVLYLFLILKAFGNSLLCLKIFEVIILTFSNLLLYELLSKIFSKNVSIIATIIYSTLLFNIFGSSIINNQHISLLMILLALYFFVKKDSYVNILISLLFLTIAYILRNSAIIVIIALVCYSIWKLFFNNELKDVKKQIRNMSLLIIIPLLLIKSYDFVMVRVINIVPNSAINANVKYFKYLLGIQEEGISGNFTYDSENTQIYYDLESYDFDYDKYNKDSKKYILNKYKNDKKEVFDYIIMKMNFFASIPDNQIVFSQANKLNSKTMEFIIGIGYAEYVLMIILSVVYEFIRIKRRKQYNEYNVLFKIVFIGFFLVYIFIEVQTRYRYEQYIILSILSAQCLEMLYNKIDRVKI